MSLRVYIGLLFLGVFLLSILFIAGSLTLLQGELAELFSSALDAKTLQTLLIADAVASILFAIFLICIMFWIIGSTVAKPLKEIVAAMQTFASTGERPPLPEFKGSPKEVRELSASFSGFADRVEQSHKHDEEISRVKSDFISTAAHQLRTPLTGIRWALEALQKEPLQEGQQALVMSAVDKSHQLVAVVGTLLDISSIESGKFKYAFVPVDLNQLLSEVARDFEPLAVQSGVTFFFEKSGTETPLVRADRERIRWVLNNLIENAIQYTPTGGQVRLTAEATPERAYVRVRDTGIGIAPEDQGNIFERFYRAPNAISKQNGGNGLGLYIARTIAADHGGDLNFSANTDGPGTTFSLSLPYAV